MKNNRLRILWIIPNVFCYIMCLALFIFIVSNVQGLMEINQFFIYLFLDILLLFISILGSFRIISWMEQGKL
ncbi:hypothetical protein A9C19_13400 [Bacillus weihaiensis]|uniref:Uncharacterized protein n=1 Tax=Bacillus weihaiensis TaxID=1547283 RepID=A0A1L3MTL0_9BACI|nr:hypothetical protein A9C19_13400 [Bacillus weihaiensis]